MTAPTLVATVSSVYSTTAAKSVTLDVQAGDLIVVTGATEDNARKLGNVPTATGNTFVLQRAVEADQFSPVYVWAATASATNAALVVTVTASTGSDQYYGITASIWRGHSGIGANNGSTGTGTTTHTLTTTGTDSAVVAAVGDWNAIDATSRTWAQINSLSATSEYYYRNASRYTTFGAHWIGAGAAGAKTVSLTSPTTLKWTLVSFEVTGVGGGSTITATPTGIASDEAFGVLEATVAPLNPATPTAIASDEAFGVLTVTGLLTVTPDPIIDDALVGDGIGAPTAMVIGADQTGTATAVASASSDTTTTRSGAGTATAVAGVSSSFTAGVRTTTGSADADASAAGTTSSVRTTTGTAAASASVTGASTTQRPTTGTAAAAASASAETSQSSPGITVGNAQSVASASAITTSIRSTDGVAAASASAAFTGSSTRIASGVALAVAGASSTVVSGIEVFTTGEAVATASATATTTQVAEYIATTVGEATAIASATSSTYRLEKTLMICYPETTNWGATDIALLDPEQRQLAEAFAWTTLFVLSGRMIAICPSAVRPIRPHCRDSYLFDRFSTLSLPASTHIYPAFEHLSGCMCDRTSVITLPGIVGKIDRVTIDGVDLPPYAYRVEDGHRLVRQDGEAWPAWQDMSLPAGEVGTFEIVYWEGFAPNAMLNYAAGVLANEYVKLINNEKNCRLPKGVTQVNRQGVTYTIDSTMFENGVTSIKEVDSVIALYNPNKLKAPPVVYSTDLHSSRLRTQGA